MIPGRAEGNETDLGLVPMGEQRQCESKQGRGKDDGTTKAEGGRILLTGGCRQRSRRAQYG